VSLVLAEEFERESAVWRRDDREARGERRFEAIGFIRDRIHALVFCLRDGKIRAISPRKALPREARRHANHHDEIRARRRRRFGCPRMIDRRRTPGE
jgi:uncharacterized DUF497 family protein